MVWIRSRLTGLACLGDKGFSCCDMDGNKLFIIVDMS